MRIFFLIEPISTLIGYSATFLLYVYTTKSQLILNKNTYTILPYRTLPILLVPDTDRTIFFYPDLSLLEAQFTGRGTDHLALWSSSAWRYVSHVSCLNVNVQRCIRGIGRNVSTAAGRLRASTPLGSPRSWSSVWCVRPPSPSAVVRSRHANGVQSTVSDNSTNTVRGAIITSAYYGFGAGAHFSSGLAAELSRSNDPVGLWNDWWSRPAATVLLCGR